MLLVYVQGSDDTVTCQALKNTFNSQCGCGESSTDHCDLTGPKGDTGLQGPTGINGETGHIGSQGPTGPTGNNGIMGLQGPPGPPGLQGPTGINGETGHIGSQGPPGPMGTMQGTHSGDLQVTGKLTMPNADSRIGIGTSTPVCPLHITRPIYNTYLPAGASGYIVHRPLALKVEGTVWVSGNTGIHVTSDIRVKQNIVEVNDDLALQQLRAIDVMYYDYIDKETYGEGTTIGFISQQVKEIIPEAVKIHGDYLPDEQREVSVVFDTFETTEDDSAVTKYKFMVDDLSGTKYKFKMLNGDKVETVELEKDENGYFICDKQYDQVYVYGKWVDDFHILSKSKLFTVNFSATQQIDNNQIILQQKVATLESQNTNLLARLEALENYFPDLIK